MAWAKTLAAVSVWPTSPTRGGMPVTNFEKTAVCRIRRAATQCRLSHPGASGQAWAPGRSRWDPWKRESCRRGRRAERCGAAGSSPITEPFATPSWRLRGGVQLIRLPVPADPLCGAAADRPAPPRCGPSRSPWPSGARREKLALPRPPSVSDSIDVNAQRSERVLERAGVE